jgi:hypothetical protein
LGEERGELRERPPKKELDDRACECMVLGFAIAMMAGAAIPPPPKLRKFFSSCGSW